MIKVESYINEPANEEAIARLQDLVDEFLKTGGQDEVIITIRESQPEEYGCMEVYIVTQFFHHDENLFQEIIDAYKEADAEYTWDNLLELILDLTKGEVVKPDFRYEF